jgi:hypothetical protein
MRRPGEYSSFKDECDDYVYLCKMMNVSPRSYSVDYDHLDEIVKLPCVIWKDDRYIIDLENFPEYVL